MDALASEQLGSEQLGSQEQHNERKGGQLLALGALEALEAALNQAEPN